MAAKLSPGELLNQLLKSADPAGQSRESVGTLAGIANFSGQLAAISAPIITGYIVSATQSFASAFATATFILLLGIVGLYGVGVRKA